MNLKCLEYPCLQIYNIDDGKVIDQIYNWMKLIC